MNRLSGHISQVEVHGNLSKVHVTLSSGVSLAAIVIETPDTAPHLVANQPIDLLFKATEVIISKAPQPVTSIENVLSGKISHIEKGGLLTNIEVKTIDGTIQAIIPSSSVDQLQLAVKLQVEILIKLNEIMLAKP